MDIDEFLIPKMTPGLEFTYENRISNINTDFMNQVQELEDIGLSRWTHNINNPYTNPELQNKPQRYYSLWNASNKFSSLPADFVQVGVYLGEQAYYMAKACKTTLHLFDSFEGVSEVTKKDNPHYLENKFVATLEECQKTLSKFNNIKYWKGWVPDNFDKVEKISLLSIDLDLYEPTKATLEYLWDKVIPGGAVMVDMHNGFAFGAGMAAKEFFANKLNVNPVIFPSGILFVIRNID